MRTILSLVFLLVSIDAQTLHYIVKAPLFGTIGRVSINYSTSSSHYNITAGMKTSGFAKTLSGNRKEHYDTEGIVKNNRYYAKHFLQNVYYKNKHIRLEYLFDYKEHKIRKIKKKWKGNKLLHSTDHYLDYFASDDLFSAYHNIVQKLQNTPDNSRFTIIAAGLERFKGRLEVFIPSKMQQQREARALKVSNVRIFHIVTHKNILGSTNGEIIFAVAPNGIAKAVRVLNTSYVSHIDAFLITN